MPSKPNPVVFVPGIMGSELTVGGATVWAADFRGLQTILNPAYVLPWLRADAGRPVALYDGLVSFLQGKGYQINVDFFLFGYDWRAGMEHAADALSRFVDQTVRRIHGGRIVFIAHSLGCLVVRWAVALGLIVSQKVELLVAAGPPSLGSTRAFRSLLELPEITYVFDRLIRIVQRLHPSLVQRVEASVTSSLLAVTSALELMPPRGIPVFITAGSPQLFGAFEWPGWWEGLHALRNRVEGAQARLRGAPWPQPITRKLILSENYPTDTGYLLDHGDFRTIHATWPSGEGDGRVLASSARAFGSDEPELLVASRHDALLDDQATLSWLDQRL